jgi:predicted esterase
MGNAMKIVFHRFLKTFCFLLLACQLFTTTIFAQKLNPGKIAGIKFPELAPSLYTMMTGDEAAPAIEYRLPDDYDTAKKYPLLVYVPGFHGNPSGNIGNAQAIAGPKGWIVASLPLFKKTIDRDEVAGGLLVSMEDYPAISKAYQTMLGKLFDLVPNIDREKSAMVGFSNGAITIGVLLSSHDEFILTHFKNFCLVDNGMFHLTDLHKNYAKDCRYLILVGDREDMGRDLKIRQSKLQEDSWKLLSVNLTFQIMKDTGHEFNPPQMDIVAKWLKGEEPKK